ncbi:MAG: thioredoxin domain-containing protein [Bacteriovoracaceae bacterium]|jgi:protein-disulfide isomerase|nr:thioredoxin domain-containing protein [Bacteriovoracaceae bacterium]
MKMKMVLILSFALILVVSCNQNASSLKETLKKDPTILTDAIKANPVEFIDALNEAVQEARKGEAKRREEAEKKKLEESFDKPLVAKIRKDELFRGDKNAPLTLIEYSDFECPFCKRGYDTVNSLLKKYKGKIRFAYKHLPLSFHPNAMPASKYFEALRLQKADLAWKFHDNLYENQSKLKLGEKYFKSVAKKLGADMKKLVKDVNSAAVQKRIDEDLAEAKKFGFNGTPGFLLNGIPVKGAYPESHFVQIIDKLVEKGKVKL